VALHLQRDGREQPDRAQATLVFRHSRSTYFMLTFNPITGEVLSEEAIPLDLDQVLLLPETGEEGLRPLLLVGADNSVQVHPSNLAAAIPSFPQLFVVRERAGTLSGSLLTLGTAGQDVALLTVWSMLSPPGMKLQALRSREQAETVHSAGRVLADRSVLFKYMNPNLALLLWEGVEAGSKGQVTAQMLDLVTGRTFYSASHKKVCGPYHVVHSENWALYSFFNEKARRTELVSLELYEGKQQSNSSMFSSIENLVSPLVEMRAFILPLTEVAALRETITGKGITSKHVLVANTDGWVLDLPLHMVDPRRPALDTPAHLREPGIPPYIPELPAPRESILNYNQTVANIKGIATASSGLESTVIVFVYGLDLYGTRLTPSKGFDLLNPDFDYLMISSVLLVLVLLSYITRKLAQRKMLNQAWK